MSGGWLPPQAPGGKPPPRFDQPPPEPEEPQPTAPAAGPTFVKEQGTTSGYSVAALVCSISSLGLLILSLGLSFVISLPLAIAGWVCAVKARRVGGQGQTGLVLSMVGVALGVAATIVWVTLIAAGFSLEEFQRNLEEELERQRQR
jgi:hypothetical protein